jgi:hypothetical protein
MRNAIRVSTHFPADLFWKRRQDRPLPVRFAAHILVLFALRAALPLRAQLGQQQIANEQQLPMVDGKIVLPDLRIEYETPEGDLDHVDLELATEHYHRGHMEMKARAGFKMYRFVSTSRGRRTQWEGRELTASVLSL